MRLQQKGNRVDFWILLNYFIVYEAYFLVGEFFGRTIRTASVIFIVVPYFLFMLSIGLSVVLWYWSMMGMSEG
jgi:hypothetical protein